MKRFFILAAAMLAVATLAVACGDKEETPGAEALTVAQMTGEYEGTFDFVPSPSGLNPDPTPQSGVKVALRVEQGKIIFPEFPTEALVTALLGEEAAGQLLPMLGKVSYEATIGTPEADAEQLGASLSTPVLRIDIGMAVLVTIESPDRIRYTKDGSLRFTLKTTRCQLGEGDAAGEPFDLVNELTFAVKKR